MRRVLIVATLLFWSALAAAQSVYFGNLHSHTSYSDGSGTPAEAYAMARAAGLDFFAITEHNHRHAEDGAKSRKDGKLIATNPQLYSGAPSSLIETANRLNKPGEFVTLYGQEISTISSGNHMNLFQVGEVVDDTIVHSGNVPELLSWMAAHPDNFGMTPLLQFNHPNNPSSSPKDYGRDDFAPADWVRSVDPFVELIEVLNAPALKKGEGFRAEAKEGYYLEYLNLGFHLAPSVGQDNHWKNWGVSTDARIGVIADSLTRESLMTALRARHTFASDDKNLKVIFRSGEALAGDIIATPAAGSTLPLTAEITDPDEPDATYRIDVLSDHPGGDRARQPVNSYSIIGNTNGRFPLDGIAFDGSGQFVLLKITQSSTEQGDSEHHEMEDRLWTAPIWYEDWVVPPTPAAIRIASLLPNPAGDETQNESVTLLNAGALPVNLTGWQLRDASGHIWALDGQIGSGQRLPIVRSGRPMSLNNDGDVIELISASGILVDKVTYGRASEGAVMIPQHQ